MNRTTIHREKLLYFIDTVEDNKAMIEWVEEQPDLDQPDIFRELKFIYEERYEKTGEKDWLEKANVIEEGIDEFEDEILDEKLHKNLFCAELEHALKDAEFTLENITAFAIYARKALIDSFLENPKQNHNKKFWEAVHLAIKFEKNAGVYDENNWNAII